jgi:CTP synthase (UTP-ammonia lyase)
MMFLFLLLARSNTLWGGRMVIALLSFPYIIVKAKNIVKGLLYLCPQILFMAGKYIKIVTFLALIIIVVIQGVWLANTYRLVESRLSSASARLFPRAVVDEAWERLNSLAGETGEREPLGTSMNYKDMDGLLIAPGFGQRGIEGKFAAIKYAREHDVPCLGICLGMQCMVIEFARDVLGYKDANSTEMEPNATHKVIDLMEEQKNVTNLGGSMRLGAYDCVLKKGSKVYEAYGQEHIQERHRHRFEFNNEYKASFEAAGMMCTGENPETNLVEVVEIPSLKWFIGVQYHPEYNSTVVNPNPLFLSFVKAAIDNKKQ